MLFLRKKLIQIYSSSSSVLRSAQVSPKIDCEIATASTGRGKGATKCHHTISILVVLCFVSTVILQRQSVDINVASLLSSNDSNHLRRTGNDNISIVQAHPSSLLLHNDANNRIIGQHGHRIPTVLTFTHRYNLLTEVFPYGQNVTDNYESLSDKEREMLALQENVRDIVSTHPESTVQFLTDASCIVSIQNVMKMLYNNSEDIANEMVEYFVNEPEGMFKGDLCRGTALYETGGLYFDVDLAIRMSLWNVVKPTTEFVTIKVDERTPDGGFFQAFIGVTQAHPVIGRYVTLFYEYYKKTLPRRDEIEGRLLGVLLLKRAYDEIELEQQQASEEATQILNINNSDNTKNQPSSVAQLSKDVASEEILVSTSRMRRAGNEDGGPQKASKATSSAISSGSIKRTHLSQTTELWYEMIYDKRLSIPYPTWGRSRNCKIIVATGKLSKDSPQGDEDNIVAPFYSRIANSRMCPRSKKIRAKFEELLWHLRLEW